MSNVALIGSYVWVYFYLLRLFNLCLLNVFHLCCATIYDDEIKLYIKTTKPVKMLSGAQGYMYCMGVQIGATWRIRRIDLCSGDDASPATIIVAIC